MAPKTTTIGRLLINQTLPSAYQIHETVTNKELKNKLIGLAKNDPHTYVDTIGKLKHVGDAIATDLGVTVGLDDIEPDYKKRDAILEPALKQVKASKDLDKRRQIIASTQEKLLKLTMEHPGQMTPMVRGGSRGKPAQLLRTVASPVATTNERGEVIPWLISKSYSEGLKPADNWVAMGEARRGHVEAAIAISTPGEISKILVNNMSDQLITIPDCGTHNGIMLSTSDPNIVDRYTAKTNTLITPQVANELRRKQSTILVRSPMTCEAAQGICQRCYGLNPKGQLHTIGANVGMVSAHAITEPLTQMALNARHAARTAAKEQAVLSGLEGFKQLTEIPQSFFNKAILASHDGKVTSVKVAPQGGHYVHMGDTEHYIPPQLDPVVLKGTTVRAGDVLSTGIPRPDEVLAHKGLDAGRNYIVQQLQNIYKGQGIDVDRRHLELVAKTDLNYVRLTDPKSDDHGFIRGDVVDFNRFRTTIAENAQHVPLAKAIGKPLGNTVLHYAVGTPVTKDMVTELKQQGFEKVPVVDHVPTYEPVMKPLSRTPLLHPDWMARLAHRNLKNVILDAAAFGESAAIHGTHPILPFAWGEEFGRGPQGRY